MVRVFFLGITPVLASCGFPFLGMPSCDSSPEAKLVCDHDYGRNPKLGDEVAKLSLEQQYRIHRFMQEGIHPPSSGAEKYIAARGKPALYYVLDRAREAHGYWEIYSACSIVYSIAAYNDAYPVCEDEAVMDEIGILEDRISGDYYLGLEGPCADVISFCEEELNRQSMGEPMAHSAIKE